MIASKNAAWAVSQTDERSKRNGLMDVVKGKEHQKRNRSLIMAAQEQALRTNQIKAKIDKTHKEGNCVQCAEL